jgi:hypothetical protein
METGMTEKQPERSKFLIIFTILIVSFLVYYSVMSVMSPGRTLEKIRHEYAVKQEEKSDADEKIFSDSTYQVRLKEKAFLQSRIALAESDSVYLSINFADSSANLEIFGVVVHSAKFEDLQMSKILRKGSDYVISYLYSSPFLISSSVSTIKKDPVKVTIAPKDTSEYKPDVVPDTAFVEPVNYIYNMSNGTRIYIYQSEEESATDRKSAFRFDLADRLRTAKSNLISIVRFQVPEYHPYIKIRIPRDDAKIIYRAIPRSGQVGIYR